MSVSSVAAVTPASAVSPSTPAATGSTDSSNPLAVVDSLFATSNTTSFSNLAVSLSEEAGVVATLTGGSTATGLSAIDLYNNLANAVQPTVEGSAGTTGTTGTTGNSGTSATTGDSAASGSASAPLDVNTAWASLIQSDPSLSSLSVQLSAQQAIVDTFA